MALAGEGECIAFANDAVGRQIRCWHDRKREGERERDSKLDSRSADQCGGAAAFSLRLQTENRKKGRNERGER